MAEHKSKDDAVDVGVEEVAASRSNLFGLCDNVNSTIPMVTTSSTTIPLMLSGQNVVIDTLTIKTDLPDSSPDSALLDSSSDLNTSTVAVTMPVMLAHSGRDGMDVVTSNAKFSPSLTPTLMTETAVLVETPRGLMLSVGDEVKAITYGDLTDASDMQGGQLISLGTNCIPVALLSQCQQNSLMEEHGSEVVFEGSGEGETIGDGISGSDCHIICSADLPLVSQQVLTVASPEEDEPRKKNRGWPKGRKRKPEPKVQHPRAPMTGYVLYAITRRQQIKQSHPHLPFTEVTKILGQEWSTMSMDKKQTYLDEAENDKQRYIDELKVFQKSEMYQNLTRKRRSKDCETLDNSSVYTDVEDDSDELHCQVCNLYFSSLHNKKEHLLGRQHLQAITDRLERELKKQKKEEEAVLNSTHHIISEDVILSENTNSLPDAGENVELTPLSKPVDVSSFVVEFMQKNYEREQEILILRRLLRKDVQENWNICKHIQELRDFEAKLKHDIKSLASHSGNLSAQISGLKVVPALFGINFMDFIE